MQVQIRKCIHSRDSGLTFHLNKYVEVDDIPEEFTMFSDPAWDGEAEVLQVKLRNPGGRYAVTLYFDNEYMDSEFEAKQRENSISHRNGIVRLSC